MIIAKLSYRIAVVFYPSDTSQVFKSAHFFLAVYFVLAQVFNLVPEKQKTYCFIIKTKIFFGDSVTLDILVYVEFCIYFEYSCCFLKIFFNHQWIA